MSENCINKTKIPIVVICAPTACGKTDVAASLFSSDSSSVLKSKAEIISADSMQVYRYMDIGTAKPDKSFQQKLPHHLIDMCTPDVQFGVGDFVRNAKTAVSNIVAQGKIPVILGGTAFYIKNFVYGLPTTPIVHDSIRVKLDKRMQQEGAEALWSELMVLDPISANRIHVNDEYRIKRALEVCIATGSPRSSFDVSQKIVEDYDFLLISLERTRQELYDRVEKRIDVMFDMSLEKEIDFLKSQGYTKETPGMKAIGYKEFFLYTSIEEIKLKIIKNTKEYVKRQQTFFKTFKEAECIHPDNLELLEKKISNFTIVST